MSTKTIGLVVVILAVVIGGYFLITSGPAETGDNTEPTPEGKKMAFSEFVKKGGSYKCEVKQVLSDMENSGTVYLSGGNIRGEYHTIAEGRPMDTFFIVKGGFSYTWSPDFPSMGWKVEVPETVAGTNAESSGTYSWGADQIGDYNCEPWVATAAMFELPSNVTFQEVGTK